MRWRRTKNKLCRRTAALGLLAGLPRGRVLDAPCGDGALARELAARGWRTCAADLEPVRFRDAEGVRFLCLDLDEPLPFADGAFDAVVSLEGVEHLLSPARCLVEFCRVLRPGGRLVLTTPNVNNVQSRWHYLVAGRFSGFRPLARRALSATDETVTHVTPPYLPTLVYVLSRHGVAVETIDVTMVRTRQWLALPLALPIWLSARRAPAGSIARTLGSWMLLLGRNVVVQGTKQEPASPGSSAPSSAWRTSSGSGEPAPERRPVSAAAARRPFSRLAERLVGRLAFRRVPLQPRLVALMRREAAAPGPAAVEALDLWDRLRMELRERLRADDPAGFLQWPPVQTTMVVRSHRRVAPALAHLRARPDWRRRWRSAVRETTLGRPRPLPRCPWSSANLIFQAHHLSRFEEATRRSLATMRTIVEFGGGYGRLCQLVHDLGFTGTYVIVDLPEVAILQRFYLAHVGLAVGEARGAVWPDRGVVTVVDLADLKALLRTRPRGEAAFVAIGSLSETPLALRDALLPDLASFDAFLVFYGARHTSLDNRAYFTGWRVALGEHDWYDVEVPHLGKAASYLFGSRRAARPATARPV